MSRLPSLLAGLTLLASLVAATPASAAGAPVVSAPSAIVMETTTGAIPFARNPDQRRPIASVTKLMTALLTLERTPLSKRQRAIAYAPGPTESLMGLRAGERLTTADLLRGLLLESANDAAASLAVDVGGSRRAFVRDMNARAKQLGLRHTRFKDPVGLDPGSQSSARDLVTLTLQLRRFPFFRKTVDRANARIESGDAPRQLRNRNTLVRDYPWVTGVKTGHTSRAGYVLVASGRQRGINLVSVVLGTGSEKARNEDSLAILRKGFAALSKRTAVKRGAIVAKVPIRFRRGAELSVTASRTVQRVVRRGVKPTVRPVGLPADVVGPIRRGQRIGQADVLVGRERVGTVSLLAAADVPAAGVTQQAKDRVTTPLGFAGVLLLFAGGVGLLIRARGRAAKRPAPRKSGARREVEGTA